MGNCLGHEAREMDHLEEIYQEAMTTYHSLVTADHSIESVFVPPKTTRPNAKKYEERKLTLFGLAAFANVQVDDRKAATKEPVKELNILQS